MVHKDFLDFIELLERKNIKYLVVGGYAFTVLVFPRNTGDIDFFISNDIENAKKVLEAINEFGFGSIGLTVEDFMNPNMVVQLGFPPRRIDIITEISGVNFDEAWSNRIRNNGLGIEANFIGLDEFVKNKLASARAKDLADVDEIRKRKVKPKK